MEDIFFYSRKDPYGWMSNFYNAPISIVLEGDTEPTIFPTTEHYYQSQKAKTRAKQLEINAEPDPYSAMVAGRGLTLDEFREDWDEVKDEIMLNALIAKFTQHDDLRLLLIQTGNAKLHENSPTDRYWGVLEHDKLGKLLMEVRERLQMWDW